MNVTENNIIIITLLLFNKKSVGNKKKKRHFVEFVQIPENPFILLYHILYTYDLDDIGTIWLFPEHDDTSDILLISIIRTRIIPR